MYSFVVMEVKTKTNPIPVRFEQGEDSFLRKVSTDTGLPVAELVRRSVRLMKRQANVFHGYAFVLDLNE